MTSTAITKTYSVIFRTDDFLLQEVYEYNFVLVHAYQQEKQQDRDPTMSCGYAMHIYFLLEFE